MLSLEEKLALWVKITGVDPTDDKRKYTIHMDGRLSDYDIKRMNDRIKESLVFDETGIFAEAYLSIYLKKFLENKKVPLSELLVNKDLHDYVEDVKKLHDSIKKTNAEALITEEAKKAMAYYKLPCSLDALTVMEIRSSAIKCMNKKLDLLQFSHGSGKADSFKLSKDIYLFRNLDALILCSARGKLNGVTLGYIRDDKSLTDSFFAFIIKNGDNLYLMTDMPKYTHPAQKKMKRCPGRDMSERINANFFPYDTIGNIDTSDLWDSGRYGVKDKTTNTITVTEDTPYTVIGTVDQMSEEESFWYVMMAALIKKKFYEEEPPVLTTSYTRNMIQSGLLEKNKNALTVQSKFPVMELKEVKIEDTENLGYERDYEEDSKKIQYLIDRYKDAVDETVLNVIKNTDRALMIEDKYAKKDYWGGKEECDYLSLDLDNSAGTQEEIEYRQKWIARYNYAKAINNLVKEDYDKKKDAIYEEIRGYITPRIGELVKMHLMGELLGDKVKREGFGSYYTGEKESISSVMEFNRFYESGDGFGKYRYGFTGHNKTSCKCAFTGKAAGVAVRIKPKNAQELALVCGISVNELPECLKHYDNKEDRYYGNCILDNIDPFLWVINDYFNQMVFDITILLSKAEYLNLCRETGVDAVKFWEDEPPVCCTSKSGTCSGSYYRRWDNFKCEHHLSKKCEKCKWYKENKNNNS